MSAFFELSGQVAMVTGAARGLGRASAQALADQGVAVVLADRDKAEVEGATAALKQRGHHTLALRCDVTKAADVARMADVALAWSGRLDTLVCNAGIQGPAGPLAQAIDEDRQQRVFDVNLRGAARLAHVPLPVLAG